MPKWLGLLLACCLQAADPPGMVRIAGGEFQRGRTFAWADYEVAWYPNPVKDDVPVRAVTLDPFWLDATEVTNQRYAVFVKATGHRAPYHWRQAQMPVGKGAYPVHNVSWDDAVAFCAWDGGKRLPTEAEWERAARGPQAGPMYPWGDREITPKDAVYNQLDGPQPVCAKGNIGGLCDLIGNVWEWCADWYGQKYYAESPDRNPPGPAAGSYRVLRGGSWFDVPPLFLTIPYRSWARPGERSPTIGFRCARP
ncbi:MAG: formylglycine-generating enzyme family protein [Bryobacteraceae bacterium]|nr:formylglycine-generating enzyme family protein [Bryobacteraceae bacterium]